ncbi:MAG: hypothetical protein HZA16_02095 [Nitrospirae bacterium]|nr:hypothetical protein [Nitrospirota bacterium]
MRKRILRNYFLINLVLLVGIVFLGVEFYEIYFRKMDIPLEAPAGPAGKEVKAVEDGPLPLDPAPFQVISELDIFRPTRSPYKEEAAQQAVPKIPPRLFGTIILGSEKTAILEDPNSKSTRIYRINEKIGGFLVSEILEDKVVLTWDGEKSEVRLREEKKGLPPVKPVAAQPPAAPQPPAAQQPPAAPQPQVQTQPGQRNVPQRPVPQRRVPQRTLRTAPDDQ